MKERVKPSHNRKDLYNFYKERANFGNPVDYEIFMSVLKEFNTRILGSIIGQGNRFYIPAGLGSFVMSKKKAVLVIEEDGSISKYGFPVDWARTKELWNRDPDAKKKKKFVYHINEDEGNNVYRFKWFKPRSTIGNYTGYKFVLSSTNRKRLKDIIKSGIARTDKYFDIDKYKKENGKHSKDSVVKKDN